MKRRLTLALVAMGALALFIAACTEEVIKEVPVVKEVVVEKEVIKEVPVEKIVEKVVIKEVPVEKIIEVEVIKEVEVEKEVVKRVVREVVATAMPLRGGLAVERAKYGGTLRTTAQGSMKSLDYRFTGVAVTIAVGINMHNQLFAWDLNFDPQPQLVQDWSVSSDGLTYTFNMRDGLKFHDGSPVTMDDVLASLNPAWLKRKTGALVTEFAADPENVIQVVSDRTFQIKLSKGYCCLLKGFILPGRDGGVIYPKRIADLDWNQDVGSENYIGTGAYKIKKWDVGNKLVLERFEEYVPRSEPGSFLAGAQIAYFDKIEMIEIPSEETKIAGLKTGEWHVVDDPALDFYRDLKDYSGITTVINRPGKLSSVIPHMKASPSDNKILRQAIQAAINVNDYMIALVGDPSLWALCPSLFFCFHAGEITTGDFTKFYNQADLVRAKELVAESGYDGEEWLHANANDYGTLTPLGPIFKRDLEDIGINVSMPGMDWSTVTSYIFDSKNFEWNSFSNWGSYGFQHNPLFNGYINTSNAFHHYESAKIVDLQNKYASTFDTAEQQGFATDMLDVYFDELPQFHFGQFFGIVPHSDRVKNLNPRIYTAWTNAYFGD